MAKQNAANSKPENALPTLIDPWTTAGFWRAVADSNSELERQRNLVGELRLDAGTGNPEAVRQHQEERENLRSLQDTRNQLQRMLNEIRHGVAMHYPELLCHLTISTVDEPGIDPTVAASRMATVYGAIRKQEMQIGSEPTPPQRQRGAKPQEAIVVHPAGHPIPDGFTKGYIEGTKTELGYCLWPLPETESKFVRDRAARDRLVGATNGVHPKVFLRRGPGTMLHAHLRADSGDFARAENDLKRFREWRPRQSTAVRGSERKQVGKKATREPKTKRK